MKKFEDLTINIIYVKGSVNALLPLFDSLLKNSQCQFQIISNACTQDELRSLNAYCQRNSERVKLLDLMVTTIMPHHEVINVLLENETSDWFCFMDSDCLATGDFLGEWLFGMDESQALFTGFPIWYDYENFKVIPHNYKVLFGEYCESHNGVKFGITYCACYRTTILKQVMKEFGITFQRYLWQNIPRSIQNQLMSAELRKEFYDTGKLINILMVLGGAKFKVNESHSLIHLGGISQLAEKRISVFGSLYVYTRFKVPKFVIGAVKMIRRLISGYLITHNEAIQLVNFERRKLAAEQFIFTNNFSQGLKIFSQQEIHRMKVTKEKILKIYNG
ncbi:MAG: glycosyltransferase family A protein [Cyclobacteriaceae bacterium]